MREVGEAFLCDGYSVVHLSGIVTKVDIKGIRTARHWSGWSLIMTWTNSDAWSMRFCGLTVLLTPSRSLWAMWSAPSCTVYLAAFLAWERTGRLGAFVFKVEGNNPLLNSRWCSLEFANVHSLRLLQRYLHRGSFLGVGRKWRCADRSVCSRFIQNANIIHKLELRGQRWSSVGWICPI